MLVTDAGEGRALLAATLRGAEADITWQTPAQRALFALATLAFALRLHNPPTRSAT